MYTRKIATATPHRRVRGLQSAPLKLVGALRYPLQPASYALALSSIREEQLTFLSFLLCRPWMLFETFGYNGICYNDHIFISVS